MDSENNKPKFTDKPLVNAIVAAVLGLAFTKCYELFWGDFQAMITAVPSIYWPSPISLYISLAVGFLAWWLQQQWRWTSHVLGVWRAWRLKRRVQTEKRLRELFSNMCDVLEFVKSVQRGDNSLAKADGPLVEETEFSENGVRLLLYVDEIDKEGFGLPETATCTEWLEHLDHVLSYQLEHGWFRTRWMLRIQRWREK